VVGICRNFVAVKVSRQNSHSGKGRLRRGKANDGKRGY
jgi:hypothetical protein